MSLFRSLTLFAVLLSCPTAFVTADEPQAKTRIAIIVGPSSHPPGTHEVAAGGRLLHHCLTHASNMSVEVDLFQDWPTDAEALGNSATIVFLGDIFPPQRMTDPQSKLTQLETLMKRGCGIACIHYATGLRNEDVPKDGNHPLLQWLGGYFATRCDHHQSIAKIYRAATIEPAAPQHPISRGWKPFTLHDEPYINNYFGANENRLADNVVALATSNLPPESPRREIVAWCTERNDTGRGFGIVMPHFYRNWANEDLRRFILNGIVWSAKLDVPAEGLVTSVSNLEQFEPAAVTPSK